jgi:hypothetical protein
MATGRRFTTALAFIALFMAGQALAAQDDRTAIVLDVVNYAKVPPGILRSAEREVSRIYAPAGVTIVWRHEPEQEPAPAARRFDVLLLCAQMSAAKIKKDRISDGVLGVAGHATGRAYIFVGRVFEHSIRFGNPHVVLGRVLAHEIGHLLLSERGHSPRGIMRSKLEVFSQGADQFTPAQREAMKVTLGEAAPQTDQQ